MKRTTLLSGAILICMCAQAQIARWVIPPAYDAIDVKVDNKMLVTDSAGVKTLWTMDGKALFSTRDQITPYTDSIATVFTTNGGLITGLLDMDGKFTALPNLRCAMNSYTFNDGHLLYRDDNGYGYYLTSGEEAPVPKAEVAYPFSGGYATFYNFDKPDKRKGQHFGYVRANGKTMRYYSINGTSTSAINPRDIRFLSSIGPDGKGIAVVKKKLYIFDTATNFFTPMTHKDAEGKECQLSLEGNHDTEFQSLPADSICITAKYGDGQIASLHFDDLLLPVRFTFADGEDSTFDYTPAAKEAVKYETRLASTGKEGAYGLSMDSTEVAAPQFQRFGLMYGDKAIAKINGKWGILAVTPGVDVSAKVNNGAGIAFTHSKADVEIRLDLPKDVDTSKAELTIADNTAITLDPASRKASDGKDGSYITYRGTVSLPQMPGDTTAVISLPAAKFSYDGIALRDISLDAKATYNSVFEPLPIAETASVANSTATVIVAIDSHRIDTDDTYYHYTLSCMSDSLASATEQLADNLYKVRIAGLKAGINDFTISIAEKGCPTVAFPYQFAYSNTDGIESVAIYKEGEAPAETAAAPAPGALAAPAAATTETAVQTAQPAQPAAAATGTVAPQPQQQTAKATAAKTPAAKEVANL